MRSANPARMRLQVAAVVADGRNDRYLVPALHHVLRHGKGLALVVERNRDACALANSRISYRVPGDARLFRTSQRRQSRAAEFPGGIFEHGDRPVRMELNGLLRPADSVAHWKRPFLAVDRELAFYITRVNGDVHKRPSGLGPVVRRVMVSFAGHPHIVMLVADPRSRVAHGPAVGVWIDATVEATRVLRTTGECVRPAGEELIVLEPARRGVAVRILSPASGCKSLPRGNRRCKGHGMCRGSCSGLGARLNLHCPFAAGVLFPMFVLPLLGCCRLPASAVWLTGEEPASTLHLGHPRKRRGETRRGHHFSGCGLPLLNAVGYPLIPVRKALSLFACHSAF